MQDVLDQIENLQFVPRIGEEIFAKVTNQFAIVKSIIHQILGPNDQLIEIYLEQYN